ncbi:MAG: DUF3037 domain-containing protein [Candidatus Eisenbacteria bacterium]
MVQQRAYYSVIQYCPDASRMEAANIGVFIAVPEMRFVRAKTSHGNDRPRRFFQLSTAERERLNAAKIAIERRVESSSEQFLRIEDVVRFVGSRGNEITLTPPRSMLVDDPERALDRLFAELVGGRPRREARRLKPILDRVFRRPGVEEHVEFNGVFEIPVVRRELRVPYAFQNGRLNLVLPQEFTSRPAALDKAMKLAIEGDLLYRETEYGVQRQLVVVPYTRTSACQIPPEVDTVLGNYKVRVVHEEQIDDFSREVEKTIRPRLRQ